ncbi:MAG: hypothetical protein P1V34_05220 [Alphaproteobacteria bacterium]|nr:hypothetical protein [Alphaproteobacteria bacterium]
MLKTIRCLSNNNYAPFASVETMQIDISAAMRARDVLVTEHLHSEFPNPALFKGQLSDLALFKGRKFLLDTNLSQNHSASGQSIYDAWSLPRFSFLTDSPLRKLSELKQFPNLGLIGVVDDDFHEILTAFEALGQGSVFFPHAGPAPLQDQPGWEERIIDVLIVGNVSSPHTTASWLKAASGGEAVIKGVLEKALERCRSGTESLWAVIGSECEAAGLDLPRERRAGMVLELETQLIAGRRRDLLASIIHKNVHYCGEVQAGADIKMGENVTVHGRVPFLDILDFMRAAKVVIDVSPSFRNGAHERVFYGQSRGAYILTEPSRFLETEVAHDMGIGFMPFDSAQIDTALSAVFDRGADEMDTLRHRALPHYATTHTWSQRVDTMLDSIGKTFWGE